jgi:hypothetical protein
MRLISTTRTFTLPNYARDGYQELTVPNIAKNYPLGGNLYIDLFNQRGGYKITFDTLTAAEYADLRAIYQDQFDNEEFLTFDRTGLSGDYESVFLNLPAESNVVWDQQAVRGLQIILEPENANS